MVGQITDALGGSPLTTLSSTVRGEFFSLLRNKPSKGFGDDPNKFSRSYTNTRGILIPKSYLDTQPIDLSRGYHFQFNPTDISDTKQTMWEQRQYAGMSFVDYIWGGGGSRVVTFQLFLDNTPASKTAFFRPKSYGSEEAKTIKVTGTPAFTYREDGKIIGVENGEGFGSATISAMRNIGKSFKPTKGPDKFDYDGSAYSITRVHERGILPEVELLQSFLYSAQKRDGSPPPKFAEGGMVDVMQFRPPNVVVFCYGAMYLEGVVTRADVRYELFDKDLVPLRGTVDIDFTVFEHTEVERKIDAR